MRDLHGRPARCPNALLGEALGRVGLSDDREHGGLGLTAGGGCGQPIGAGGEFVPPILPSKVKRLAPAWPVLTSRPGTPSSREHFFLSAFFFVGLTHFPLTLRPWAVRLSVNVTVSAPLSV